MHQFIGDLLTSGNTLKDHPDVLNAAWGVAGSSTAALGFKVSSLESLQRPPPAQHRREAQTGRPSQPGAAPKKGESRDGRAGESSD